MLTGISVERRCPPVDNEHHPREFSDTLLHAETLGAACAVHRSNLCDAMKYLS